MLYHHAAGDVACGVTAHAVGNGVQAGLRDEAVLVEPTYLADVRPRSPREAYVTRFELLDPRRVHPLSRPLPLTATFFPDTRVRLDRASSSG